MLSFLDIGNYILKEDLIHKLIKIGKSFEINLSMRGLDSLYTELTEELHRKFNKMPVVIIDVYDAPVNRHFKDLQTAEKMLNLLRDFYDGVKNNNVVYFLFVTGISNKLFLIF